MSDTVIMPKELTAENGGKSLMMGEFHVEHESPCMECADLDDWDEEDCIYCNGSNVVTNKITIDWATIKAIYAKAVDHFGSHQ